MTMTTAALLDRGQDKSVAQDEGNRDRVTRRRFSADYKLGIVAQYDALTDPGAKGALLRREGLYSSHITEWRRARDLGALKELAPKARKARRSPQEIEIDRLRRRNQRLEDDLTKHRLVVEIQGLCRGRGYAGHLVGVGVGPGLGGGGW